MVVRSFQTRLVKRGGHIDLEHFPVPGQATRGCRGYARKGRSDSETNVPLARGVAPISNADPHETPPAYSRRLVCERRFSELTSDRPREVSLLQVVAARTGRLSADVSSMNRPPKDVQYDQFVSLLARHERAVRGFARSLLPSGDDGQVSRNLAAGQLLHGETLESL